MNFRTYKESLLLCALVIISDKTADETPVKIQYTAFSAVLRSYCKLYQEEGVSSIRAQMERDDIHLRECDYFALCEYFDTLPRWKETVKKASYTPPTPVKKRKTKFMWPVKGTVISNFGSIGKGRNNDGINIKAPLGTAVKCADAGTVAYAGNELKGFGNLILVKHNDGWITAYAHNDKILVKKGQKVRRGEKIATVGSTGGVNSPQLHFEIRAGKKAVNPRSYLQ